MDKFYLPTRVFFGKDVLLNNKGLFNNLKNKKPLIITGKSSAKISGAIDDLKSVIGSKYFIFDQISENPKLSTVLEGVDVFKEKACDYIIGIGGGSPIDGAKAISICAKNNISNPFDLDLIRSTYDIIAIPTTSGSGTEATKNSVINDDLDTYSKKGISHDLIFPKISFIDPKYTLSLNKKVTIDTGIDALSHLLEGVYSINRSRLNFPIINYGIKLVLKYLPMLVKDLSNYVAREKLSLASYYGGLVIAQSGTTLQHSIGYQLTYKYGLSHGHVNGLFMNQIFDLYYKEIPKIIDEIFYDISIKEFKSFISSFEFNNNLPIKFKEINFDDIYAQIYKAGNTSLSPINVNDEVLNGLFLKV